MLSKDKADSLQRSLVVCMEKCNALQGRVQRLIEVKDTLLCQSIMHEAIPPNEELRKFIETPIFVYTKFPRKYTHRYRHLPRNYGSAFSIRHLAFFLWLGVFCPVPEGTRTERMKVELSNEACECSICSETVKRADPIWSCEGCYNIFHLQCIAMCMEASSEYTIEREICCM